MSSGETHAVNAHINEGEAAIVRRIFEEFAQARSPRAIAQSLNKERIAGPAGRNWGPSHSSASTIGSAARAFSTTSFIGRLVWNRQQFIKDPDSGRRQARVVTPKSNGSSRRCHSYGSLTRIYGARQGAQVGFPVSGVMTGIRSERARRPNYLLSGLLKCGACGGGFSKISQSHYGCSTARNKGTCHNLLAVRRDQLEATVLDGAQVDQLMQPELVTAFIVSSTGLDPADL